jgi:hypothetical protein
VAVVAVVELHFTLRYPSMQVITTSLSVVVVLQVRMELLVKERVQRVEPHLYPNPETQLFQPMVARGVMAVFGMEACAEMQMETTPVEVEEHPRGQPEYMHVVVDQAAMEFGIQLEQMTHNQVQMEFIFKQ